MKRRSLPLGAALAAFALCVFSPSASGRDRRRRPRRPDTSPAVGALAPDFELVTVEHLLKSGDGEAGKRKDDGQAEKKDTPRDGGDEEGRAGRDAGGRDAPVKQGPVKEGHVRLSSFRGKMPVVFVLTSYT